MRAATLAMIAVLAATPVQAQRVMNYGKAPAASERKLDTEKIGIDQRLGEQVPLDLVFRDESDREITLGSCVGGKPTVLVLAYYHCPQMCNEVMFNLVEELKRIPGDVGDQFNVVVVSFDPKDQPGNGLTKRTYYLKEYGRPNADKGWHFLCGKQEPITELCEAVGFRYEYDAQRKEFNHASGIMVLTPLGKLSKYFYGIKYDGLQAALEDAGGEKIGKEVEPNDILKMLCYTQDPVTGKYSLSVMKGLRFVFGAMVLGLGIWLVRVWRRPSAKAQEPAQTETVPGL